MESIFGNCHLIDIEEQLLFPNYPKVKVTSDQLSQISVKNLNDDIWKIILTFLDIDDYKDLRNFCIINPKTTILNKQFKTKYKYNFDILNGYHDIDKSFDRFFNLNIKKKSLKRIHDEFVVVLLTNSHIIGHGISVMLFMKSLGNKITDIYNERTSIKNYDFINPDNEHLTILLLPEVIYYFHDNDKNLLKSILDEWTNRLLYQKKMITKGYFISSNDIHNNWINNKSEIDLIKYQKKFIEFMIDYIIRDDFSFYKLI